MTQQPAPETDEPHVCKPGATVYYCPTAADTESDCHGGFDVCCSAPDLHQQVLKCSLAHCCQVHPPHSWEPQPGMKPVHCEGFGVHRNEPMEALPITLDRTKVMQITATNVTSAASITIPGTAGPLVTIRPDGRLEYGPGYEPDEAARLFWDAMRRWAPPPMEKQFGRPLTQSINAELARGEAALAAVQRITALHVPVQHMGQVWCGECSVRRSTGPKSEEWVAFIPYPCPTLNALDSTEITS
ncbi:hypothetical protein [Streptomyces cyaneofuscatus]|uniref:hypothetical protein n=1 Tax=Streptomyces cyaneofuscatus TaxID=66883 RepID=UPI0036E7B94D